jgi:hypothetical protein
LRGHGRSLRLQRHARQALFRIFVPAAAPHPIGWGEGVLLRRNHESPPRLRRISPSPRGSGERAGVKGCGD